MNILNVHGLRKSVVLVIVLIFTVIVNVVDSNFKPRNVRNSLESYIQELPFCVRKPEHASERRVLYVSTVDGQLSALDMRNKGHLLWKVSTGPGPLVSSSIQHSELTSDGEFIRMIPSLSGGIYKFNGESIDPIPINIDDLLTTPKEFSENLVIAGGKETRTYGVSLRTGEILYECAINGCVNKTHEMGMTSEAPLKRYSTVNDDMIVVRRHTQTVRAVESRNGNEHWAFSVGQHDLEVIKSAECHDVPPKDFNDIMMDVSIKIIMPNGIIGAFSKAQPKVMLWKYEFDNPIANVWRTGSSPDKLETVDMFGSALWLWEEEEKSYEGFESMMKPSIYLGMFDKKLYIQESLQIQKDIINATQRIDGFIIPNIQWATFSESLGPIFAPQERKKMAKENLTALPDSETGSLRKDLIVYDAKDNAVATQTSPEESVYTNRNGYFFYTHEDVSHCTEEYKENKINSSAEQCGNVTLADVDLAEELSFNLINDMEPPTKIVILSLWFWWKEIMVIAFTSALLFNFLCGHHYHLEREVVVIERHIPVPTAIEAMETTEAALLEPPTKNTSLSSTDGCRIQRDSTSSSNEQFSSRFQSDFDLIRCLGRGGFGLVFEAKNKLDDCSYAVKRITLPNKKESRERVLREVKTLANCEHQNIVRYFQAWVETPPSGWQESEDGKLLIHEFSTSMQIETPNEHSSLNPACCITDGSEKWLNEKQKHLMSWISNAVRTLDEPNTEKKARMAGEIIPSELESSAFSDGSSIGVKSSIEASDSGAPSMATHSDDGDIGANSNNLTCSQQSDSFQIEFVHSNGHMRRDNEHGSCVDGDLPSHDFNRNEISTEESRNHCIALHQRKAIPTKMFLYIQMQLCRKESLSDWLRDNNLQARTAQIGSIFHQIVDAVDYVHFKGLIHRDLKPSNIFFSQDGQIKIGDFGLVTDMSDIPIPLTTKCAGNTVVPARGRHTKLVGTRLYMSPEQLLGRNYDYKVDIFSLGLIFFELLFYFGTEMERFLTLCSLRDGIFPRDFHRQRPVEFNLLKVMLSPQPAERPSTIELKQHLQKILSLQKDIGGDVTVVAAATDFSAIKSLL